MISGFKKVIKRFFKYIISFLLFFAILWICYFLIYGNFHKVDRDVYRSAQLFSFNMPYYIEKYNIHSILNLRGVKSSKKWYRDELNISKEYNVIHYDYKLKSRKIVTMQEIQDIINIIKEAPKPILIHCKAGADRTSLVTALYLYEVKHDKNAYKAISLLYGHFPWLGSKTIAMDKSFQNYINHKLEKQ